MGCLLCTMRDFCMDKFEMGEEDLGEEWDNELAYDIAWGHPSIARKVIKYYFKLIPHRIAWKLKICFR